MEPEQPDDNIDIDNLMYDNMLPCNKCIRAGFTYVYQNLDNASEYFRNLDQFEDYDGACCRKNKDGSLDCGEITRKGKKEEIGYALDRPNSDAFVDKNLAIAACPTKQTACGQKRVFIYDSEQDDVTLDVKFTNADFQDMEYNLKDFATGFSENDECHWLIQSKCGLPRISVFPRGEDVKDGSVRLSYIEWQPSVAEEMEYIIDYPSFT